MIALRVPSPYHLFIWDSGVWVFLGSVSKITADVLRDENDDIEVLAW